MRHSNRTARGAGLTWYERVTSCSLVMHQAGTPRLHHFRGAVENDREQSSRSISARSCSRSRRSSRRHSLCWCSRVGMSPLSMARFITQLPSPVCNHWHHWRVAYDMSQALPIVDATPDYPEFESSVTRDAYKRMLVTGVHWSAYA